MHINDVEKKIKILLLYLSHRFIEENWVFSLEGIQREMKEQVNCNDSLNYLNKYILGNGAELYPPGSFHFIWIFITVQIHFNHKILNLSYIGA